MRIFPHTIFFSDKIRTGKPTKLRVASTKIAFSEMLEPQTLIMTRTTLLALALTIATAPNLTRGGPANGENADAFNTFCLVINAANYPNKAAPLVTKAEEILQYAAAVNITLNGPEGVDELIANAENEHKNLKNGTLQSKNCGGDKWEFCKKGAAKAKSITDNSEFNAWRLAARPRHVVKQIVETVQTMTAIAKELATQEEASKDTIVAADLAKALNGGDGNEGKYALYDNAEKRKAGCGNTAASEKGKQAGNSLAEDTLCLCGTGGSQTTRNVCSKIADDAMTKTAANPDDVKTEWARLKGICERMRTTNKTTPDTIRAAVAHFTTMISKTQSTGNKINVLGTVHGNGDGGCDGKNDGNGGACVYYGTGDGGGLANIHWLQLMLAAADKLDAARQAAAKAYALEAQLISLNKTLATLATETTAAATSKPDTEPGTTQDKQQDTGKQKECEKHTDKTAEQCKSLGCDHDAENKKCKTKVVEETGKEEGAAEADKCKGKSQTDCKDGCNWDGKECKDSSILVNKHFALSVVSAAFVALLF